MDNPIAKTGCDTPFIGAVGIVSRSLIQLTIKPSAKAPPRHCQILRIEWM